MGCVSLLAPSVSDKAQDIKAEALQVGKGLGLSLLEAALHSSSLTDANSPDKSRHVAVTHAETALLLSSSHF